MIYKSIEEMKNAYKNMNKDSGKEMERTLKKDNKKFYKRFFKISLVYVIIAIIVQLTMDGFVFVVSTYQNTPYYKITINGETAVPCYQSIKKIPVIPFILYIGSADGGCYIEKDNDFDGWHHITEKGPINIEIKSYLCYVGANYGKRTQIKCDINGNRDLVLQEEKEYNMKIVSSGKEYKVLYEGQYLNDISKYLNKDGDYVVYIIDKHGFVKTEIDLPFIVKYKY